jgi:hypothetical protein
LRRSSREMVDGARPSCRAIAQTPSPEPSAGRSPPVPQNASTGQNTGPDPSVACRHRAGTTEYPPPPTLGPRQRPPPRTDRSRSRARTRAPLRADATELPATSSATDQSAPSSTPQACPSTPPRSRCCDDRLNPPSKDPRGDRTYVSNTRSSGSPHPTSAGDSTLRLRTCVDGRGSVSDGSRR